MTWAWTGNDNIPHVREIFTVHFLYGTQFPMNLKLTA